MVWRGRGPLWLGIALLVVASVGKKLQIKLLLISAIETDAQKDIPTPKMSKLMGPTIKFLYCYS